MSVSLRQLSRDETYPGELVHVMLGWDVRAPPTSFVLELDTVKSRPTSTSATFLGDDSQPNHVRVLLQAVVPMMSMRLDRLDARIPADRAHARADTAQSPTRGALAVNDNGVVEHVEHAVGPRVAVRGLDVVVYGCVAGEGAFFRDDAPLLRVLRP